MKQKITGAFKFIRKKYKLYWPAYIPLVTLFFLPLSLYTIYLFPLFPDEIAVRPYLSRLPYDFPYRAGGVGACFSNFYQIIPFTQYLPGGINWLTHGLVESPTSLRQIGLLIFITWYLVFSVYIIRKTKEISKGIGSYHILPISLITALFFIGVYPIFLILNRNEQMFFPSIIILMEIFLISSYKLYSSNLIKKILILLLYFITTSLILYAHGKALFLLPFFIIVGWKLSKIFNKSKLVFILIVGFLLINAIEGFLVWRKLYRCPDYLEFEIFLKSFAIDPTSLVTDTREFLIKLYISLTRTIEYLGHITFKTDYIWNYLPPQKETYLVTVTNLLIKINVSLLFIGTLFGVVIFYLRDFSRRNYISTNFLLLVLLLTLIINSSFNLTKNFYDADYFYTLLVIIFIFFIMENNLFDIRSKKVIFALAYLCSVSAISQYIFVSQNLTQFRQGFSGPGVPIGLYEKANIHQSIQSATELCNIDAKNGNHIITDDLTYGYFRKSHGPISYTYIFVDSREEPLRRLFRNIDSDGMVIPCGLMKEDLRQEATKVGLICCLSKSKIKDIFREQ